MGETLALVRRIPTPASTQPVARGTLGPHAATQRPVRSEATTTPTARGTKLRASSNGELAPTVWRYNATMKKIAKVPR
jgi:hypothetical protein